MDNGGGKGGRGALIVLEGLDRSGKSSQCARLLSFLQGKGCATEGWRFPDRDTSVGKMISAYLANESQLDDRTIHLLFSANRWEKRSVPVVKSQCVQSDSGSCRKEFLGNDCMICSVHTMCNSFSLSDVCMVLNMELFVGFVMYRSLMESKLLGGTTLVVDRYSYSGVAFSAAKGLDIGWCKAPEVGLLAPDLVIYLDVQPEKAAERGGYGGERYERVEFQKSVAGHYHSLRDSTWKVVDGSLPMETVEEQLRELAMNCISECQDKQLTNLAW
ncbi:Thymidylate kinase [Hordeum vulgare]|nr:Thymidylate kinase [Hordeum vulgare]